MQYIVGEFFPVNAPAHLRMVWTGLIQPNQWPQLVGKSKTGSLRQLAKEYGVSYETVRRTLQIVKLQSLRRIADGTSVMANAE